MEPRHCPRCKKEIDPSLPPEIIDQILTYTDCETFMSMRQSGHLGKELTDLRRHADKLEECRIKERLKHGLRDFVEEFAPADNKLVTINREEILNTIVEDIYTGYREGVFEPDVDEDQKDERSDIVSISIFRIFFPSTSDWANDHIAAFNPENINTIIDRLNQNLRFKIRSLLNNDEIAYFTVGGMFELLLMKALDKEWEMSVYV